MAKKTTKKTQKATAATNGDVEFTTEQRKVLDQMSTSAAELADSLAKVFGSEQLTAKQKRAVKKMIMDPIAEPFTQWRKEYLGDVEARKEEREQARVERIAKRRAKLAEQKKRLAEREARLQKEEKELASR